MPRGSTGTYTQPAGTTAVAGATIDPTANNTLITDIGTELTNSLDRQGRSAMLADLPMGAHKISNMADPAAAQDAATKNYVDTTTVPSARTIATGTGLSGGGDLSANRTIALANTAVTAGSYTNASITVNAQGQVTAASNGPQIAEGGFRALKILTTSSSALTVSADMLTLWDTSFSSLVAHGFSQSISTASSGAGGLDTGSIAANTWYAVWVIGKTDGTLAAMLSLSATAPTMPTGYTLKARYGWVRTDGNGSPRLYQQVQYGRRAQIIVDGTIITSPRQVTSIGGSGLFNVSLANFVPTTACMAFMHAFTNNGGATVAPNTNYALEGATYAEVRSNQTSNVLPVPVLLETAQQVAVGSAITGATFYCSGWEDNL